MPVKRQMKLWVVVLAAAISYGIVFLVLAQQKPTPANIAENQTPAVLPAVTFYDAAGKPATLADFKGKPLVVNLWATWCPPCVGELPSLDKLQGKMRRSGLKVIAIAMDRGDDMKPVTAFLHKQRIEHLSAYWDKDHQVMENWHEDDLPVSYLISRDGKVVKKYEGPFVWDKGEMLAAVQAVAKEK